MGLLAAIGIILLISIILIGIVYLKDRGTNKPIERKELVIQPPEQPKIELPPIQPRIETIEKPKSVEEGKKNKIEIPQFKELGLFNGQESYSPSKNQFSNDEISRGLSNSSMGYMPKSDDLSKGAMIRGTDNRKELENYIFNNRFSMFEEMNGKPSE